MDRAPATDVSAPGGDAYAVAFDGVTKAFGATVANDGVSFQVARGTIHAVVGENGAGKTTLMNLLYGVYRPDSGRIRLAGRPVAFRGPRDAIAAGIGMIHQRLSLVAPLTVLENIILGGEPRRWRGIDWGRARTRVRALMETHGLEAALDAPVADLDIASQQRVEIVKALYRDARVLVLDEPTTVLGATEYGELVRSLRRFSEGGGTVLYISHRLPEIFDVCERVTVLRGGRVVQTCATGDVDAERLAQLMVGEAVSTTDPVASGPPLSTDSRVPAFVTLSDIVTPPRYGDTGLAGLSLQVRVGEILGIAGVAGNGQGALARVLVGRERPVSGDIVGFDGAVWNAHDVRARRRAGVAWIPPDRAAGGLVAMLSVADNVVLGRQGRPPFARAGVRAPGAVRAAAAAPLQEFDVRPPLPDVPAGMLSGGNQQKILVARELGHAPRLLVAEHPTRGVDVFTMRRIHDRLRALSRTGAAVVCIAADLEELLQLADRVVVLSRGRVVHAVAARDTSPAMLAPLLGGMEKAGPHATA